MSAMHGPGWVGTLARMHASPCAFLLRLVEGAVSMLLWSKGMNKRERAH